MVPATFSATQIASTCTSTEPGRSSVTTTVNNLVVGGQTFNGPIAPNTAITIAGVGVGFINEQIVTDTTTTTGITVNGLHITTLAGTDYIVSQSQCSLAGDALAPPLAVVFRSFDARASKLGVS